MNDTWNPWHGCRKISAGCKNCYVYRRDAQYDIDSTAVVKNKTFYAPAERYKYGNYKMVPENNIIYTCFTSDFFLDEADKWRDECWQMIKQRRDVTFFIITKRIHRFAECIPDDWGDGYDNVHICCTCENQKAADRFAPIETEMEEEEKEEDVGEYDCPRCGYHITDGKVFCPKCGAQTRIVRR